MQTLTIKNKTLRLPVFMPDATKAVIRGVSSDQLIASGVEGLVVNTFHLSNNPGASVLNTQSGIHEFMNWEGLVISDSGGFQLLSLVYENASSGNISDKGISFSGSFSGRSKKYMFTPEKSIKTQFSIGAEIMICLDDCPKEGCSESEAQKSVERTLNWAKRCKMEFQKQVESKGIDKDFRPLLFGVIQGGDYKYLREKCAAGLIEIGFDGYGFGGWPLMDNGDLNSKILKLTADLMPNDKPKYALGVGSPEYLISAYKMGYSIFDCVLPTRDGRHGRIYILNPNISSSTILEQSDHVSAFMYIKEERYVRDGRPIDPGCDCPACRNYSRAYINHLFKIDDNLAGTFASVHNIRTYTRIIKLLREAADDNY
jgi:queuine tRNA-ribosyltransferase